MADEEKDENLEHKAEEYGGKAKEAVGKVTGDDDLAQQGRNDQAKSSLKQAGEKLKQALRGK
jgi:uncharacterized protein YjbJ (UPF0337 family)